MATEIERRFLVKGTDWKNLAKKPKYFRQGYLSTRADGWTTRIRIIDTESAWLTLKLRKTRLTNQEFEYQIPKKDALAIWELAPHRLTKIRQEIILADKSWVVDSYEQENAPLVLAEVELEKEEEQIQIPSWCCKEITGLKKFSNAALALHPLTSWPKSDLAALGLNE